MTAEATDLPGTEPGRSRHAPGSLVVRGGIAALVALIPLLIYVLPWRYNSIGDANPNELLPISLLVEHDLDFEEFTVPGEKLPYWLGRINGRVVSRYPVIPGILNLPVFALARVLGIDIYRGRFGLSLATTSTIAALSTLAMYLCLLRVCARRRTALLFAFAYAFGTSTWSVASQCLWQHGPSLLFITFAIFLLLARPGRLTALSGLLLGLAVFNRPTNALIALPLTLYVARHCRDQLKWYLVWAGIPLSLLCLYSWTYWGSIRALGQGQGTASWDGAFWPGLFGLLVSPARGMLIFSPIFLFNLACVLRAREKREVPPLFPYLGVSALLLLLLCARWRMWWGGHCFGCRLLTETIPLLILPMAALWESTIGPRRSLRALFGVCLAASVFVHFLGAVYYHPSGFNCLPNNVDEHPERLWQVRDTEIVRCARAFGESIRDHMP